MSAIVKLAARLPGDEETNGLDAYHDQLLDETILVGIVWFTPREVRRTIPAGDEVPVVEIRKVEIIGEPSEVPMAVVELANRLQEQRTGRVALPFGELVVPKSEVGTLRDDGEQEVRAANAEADALMDMSPAEREDAMADGPVVGYVEIDDPIAGGRGGGPVSIGTAITDVFFGVVPAATDAGE